VKPTPQIDRTKALKRCRAAANVLCLLCFLNLGPVLLVTAMGMAGAAMTHPERNFNSVRAMVTGAVLFGLPFLVGQAFVRRGSRGAILFSILVALLFLAGATYLMINVVAGPFLIQFKLLAGLLSLVAIVGYGLGIFRLCQAAQEIRREQASVTGR
jgi:hypothetical protein